MKKLFLMMIGLLGFSSSLFAADPMIGLRYQITTVMGSITQTYTLAIDMAGSGKYYSGILEGYDVRLTGPKTGSQLCMTSEALYDYAFTFCFNASVRNDQKAFTAVTTWKDDDLKVILYSDVYRATVVRYRLKPTTSPPAVQATSADRANDAEARNQRGILAFERLNAYKQ